MSSLPATSSLPAIPATVRAEERVKSPGADRLHVSGLLVIFLLSSALALATASECQSITHLPSLLYGVVLWIWWGLIAGLLWSFAPRTPSVLRFSPLAIALHLAVGCVVALVYLLLLGGLSFVVPAWRGHAPPLAVWTSLLHLNRFGLEILIYGFIFGLIGIIQFQLRAQRDAMRSMELERQLSAAHLRALQMQLEPHFLFNTLNAITALVELGRQQQAAEMLGHLNVILKSTLKRTTPEKVALSQELELVENYLAIEQVRFADRLRVEFKVEPNALRSLVPCFLLQPIVENAIRHGLAHCEDEGRIEASARREGDRLQIEIRDSGSGSSGHAQPGGGIGLKNTGERLAWFYGDAYELQAQPLASGGFRVTMNLPWEQVEPC